MPWFLDCFSIKVQNLGTREIKVFVNVPRERSFHSFLLDRQMNTLGRSLFGTNGFKRKLCFSTLCGKQLYSIEMLWKRLVRFFQKLSNNKYSQEHLIIVLGYFRFQQGLNHLFLLPLIENLQNLQNFDPTTKLLFCKNS